MSLQSRLKRFFDEEHAFVLLRHCKTSSAKDNSVEADLERVPNAVGIKQCEAAQNTWFKDFDVRIVFHSEARRTKETAELLLKERSSPVVFHKLNKMYGSNCPEVEKAFSQPDMGYLPLASYIDAVGEEVLSKYADNVVEEMLAILEAIKRKDKSVGKDICIVSHAVYVSAIAQKIFQSSGMPQTKLAEKSILTSNIAEVSGFYITKSNLTYLGSTL